MMYLAKKKAEGKPGVGRETDVCLIDRNDNGKLKRAGVVLASLHRRFDKKVQEEIDEIIKTIEDDPRFRLPKPRRPKKSK